jgi:hypothetical protein
MTLSDEPLVKRFFCRPEGSEGSYADEKIDSSLRSE